jgi:tRNA dimethylallyltransferase
MEGALLIAGPTASGKSALALSLAERLGGVIINADAMQVYADLRVLTARPSPDEEARAPHRLFGHVDAAVARSAGDWLREAAAEIESARAAGAVPILVGGTGLFFTALTEGLADIPDIPAEIREQARAEAAADAPAAHVRLAVLDPAAAARLSPNDAVRIARALEVARATGRPLSAWQADTRPELASDAWSGVVLTPPRAALYAAINTRFDAMLAGGALEEARALWARGLPRDLPAMKAHGMPALCAHFDGEIDLEETARRGALDTRHYAKRQFTWARGRMAGWRAVTATALEDRINAALQTPLR